MNWEVLAGTLSKDVLKRTEEYLTPSKWDLLSDRGKREVALIGEMLVQVNLMEASGVDVTNAKAALTAALGNWSCAVMITGASVGEEMLDDVKEALISAAEVTFQMLGAGLRGFIFGL